MSEIIPRPESQRSKKPDISDQNHLDKMKGGRGLAPIEKSKLIIVRAMVTVMVLNIAQAVIIRVLAV